AINPQRGVIDNVLAVAGWSTGIVLGLFILGSLRRRVSSGAAVGGVLAGAAAGTLVMRPGGKEALLAWPGDAAGGAVATGGVALLAQHIADVGAAAKRPEE